LPKDRAGPLAQRQILVVDDQPSIRGLLEVALSEAGAEVWSAPDGPAALASMESMLPDLILLDLAMPAMDGWQVIDRLLASRRTSGIPVILQTSAVDFTSFERARRRGVAAFISKPFRLNEVVETCRRILEGARPLQGHPAAPDDAPALQVRDAQGNLLSMGRLLDLADRGAQAELDSPLELGQRVVLTVHEGAGPVTLEAEVRWVTRAGDRYHHGLVLCGE
jgi:CheY-like chemotaxis protein